LWQDEWIEWQWDFVDFQKVWDQQNCAVLGDKLNHNIISIGGRSLNFDYWLWGLQSS